MAQQTDCSGDLVYFNGGENYRTAEFCRSFLWDDAQYGTVHGAGLLCDDAAYCMQHVLFWKISWLEAVGKSAVYSDGTGGSRAVRLFGNAVLICLLLCNSCGQSVFDNGRLRGGASGKENQAGYVVLCTLLAFGLGMQGVRGMLVFYGPLFGMEVIRNLYRIYCKEKADKTDRLVSLWVVCLLLLNFLGTLFPVSIDQELSRNIRKGFQKLFTEVVPNMITAVGLEAANPLEKAALVFLLCVIILLGVDIALRMFRKETIGAAEWSFLIICASPVITALMMAFTTFETTERYYFMLTYAFAMAAVLAFIRLRTLRKRHLSKTVELLLAAAVAVIVVSNLFSIYIPIVKTEEPPQSREYEIAQYLEENGFQTGYSTFHHANNLTVLSNGRVRVAAVASLDRMNVCRWLSSSDWYVPNVPYEERTAYIVPEAEMENFAEFLKLHEKDLRFETQIGNYSIYSSAYNFSNMEY